MSLNTIHNSSKDLITGVNKTQNSVFRFEIATPREASKFAFSQGLNIEAIKLTIKVNGKCDLKVDDVVSLLGLQLIVISTSASVDDNLVLKRRVDINDVQGTTYVALQ